MIDDKYIEKQRIARDITLILKNGSDEEKSSLLRVIELLAGKEEKERIENWMMEGFPEE